MPLKNPFGSTFVRLLLITLVLTAALKLPQPTFAQSNVTVTIHDPSGKTLATVSATYLGHGVVAAPWKIATLQGVLQATQPNLFVSPRHRLTHYMLPAPGAADDPRDVALTFALCGTTWQPIDSGAATPDPTCLPFDVASLTTVTGTDGQSIAVKRLLYADQTADIALLELNSVPDWPVTRVSNQVTNSITVGQNWVNDLYLPFISRDDTPLKDVLNDGLIGPTIGGGSIGDPTTPHIGNTGYSVTHYDLALDFDVDRGTLNGAATLDVQALYPQLSRFSLDFATLTAKVVTLDGQTIPFQQDKQAQKLYINPTQPLTAGQKFKLVITYGGQPHTFNSPYLRFLPIGMWIYPNTRHIFDVDEPDGAHSWFPCNDHPLDLATFTYHITVGDNLYAAANGQLQGQPTNNPDGTRTFNWDMPFPMATYLAVVAIADYAPRTLPSNTGIPLTLYAYAADADKAAQTMQITGSLMQIEINRFGSFPFKSYGQVLAQQNSVGMESQTMTVLPDTFSAANPDEIFVFVGHEMAHQWYGDSVALSDWGEIWLNEGFASYAEYIDLQDSNFPDQAANLLRQYNVDTVNGSEVEPLVRLNPDDLFGINAYDKGAYLLHMLREQIGDAAFFKTMQTYAARFRYHNATSDDFWAVAEEVSGKDLSQFFTQWLDYPDLPNLDVTWTESGGQVQALVCQRSAQPFTLDVPIEFSADSTLGTPNPPSTSVQDDTIHVNGVETHVQFPVKFDVANWNVDPNGTTLAKVNLSRADSVPAHCQTAPTSS